MAGWGRLLSVVAGLALLLALLALLAAALGSPGAAPSVEVVWARWALSSEGYVLYMNVSASGRVQLLGVEVGGRLLEVVRDVEPPHALLRVPTVWASEEVRLHFSAGPPIAVRPYAPPVEPSLSVVCGCRALLLYGALPSGATATVLRVPPGTRVLLVVPPGRGPAAERLVERALPGLVDVVEADELSWGLLEGYTTLVFSDVAPDPETLRTLAAGGKAVVLHCWERPLGQLRVVLGPGGAAVREVSGAGSDVDYLGAHCLEPAQGRARLREGGPVSGVLELYGEPGARWAAVPTPYCLRQFAAVYATARGGGVAAGRTAAGFHFAGIELRHVLLLAAAGFFEGRGGGVEVVELSPFRGVRPLLAEAEPGAYLVRVEGRGLSLARLVRCPPVSCSASGGRAALGLGIDWEGRPAWRGAARVRVVELSLSGEPLGTVLERGVALPASLVFEARPDRAYLVYVNGTPAVVVVDEEVLRGRPRVVVEYSAICELFSLRVRRLDGGSAPLLLEVNGRPAAVLRGGGVYEERSCVPGFYEVVVRDALGRPVEVVRFRAVRIYESPPFLVALLGGGCTAAAAVAAVRRRAVREAEEVTLVLYRLPEAEERAATPQLVAALVSSLSSSLRRAPRVEEVLRHVYRRHPTVRAVAEAVEALRQLLGRGRRAQLALVSRYVPELGDTLTIVVPRGADPAEELYHHVVAEVLRRFGGVCGRGEVRDVVDVDAAAVLGGRLLLLTYAPGEGRVRSAVDRALTGFVRVRRMRLPLELVGVAVVTEEELVPRVARLIDAVLSGDAETAGRVLRDMTVFTQLQSVPREEWLRSYVLAAVPVTRLAPLFAFAKAGAAEVCNRYYRALYAQRGPQTPSEPGAAPGPGSGGARARSP